MKLNHITALLLFLTVFAFAGYSQVEDEEVQMFSIQGQPKLTRGAGNQQVLDFGILKKDAKVLKIDVQNPSKTTDLKIGNIILPEGIGVFVLNSVIKPGQKGEIAIMVDPKYMKPGDFKKEITISASSENKGILDTKSIVFGLKGQIL
jgi:hypothetical protein